MAESGCRQDKNEGWLAEEDTFDLMIEESVTLSAGSPAIFLPMLHYIRTLEVTAE